MVREIARNAAHKIVDAVLAEYEMPGIGIRHVPSPDRRGTISRASSKTCHKTMARQ
jgi:hypothetical protein